jgi:hypothetical protein
MENLLQKLAFRPVLISAERVAVEDASRFIQKKQ